MSTLPFLQGADAPSVYVLHENDEWIAPLKAAFDEIGMPLQTWHLAEGAVDLSATPPEGVFYNRMSASSHTRGHRYAPEFTAAVLAWLKRHDRVVVNGERALALEVSKVAQYEALKAHCVTVPHTIAVAGAEHIAAAADAIGYPVIVKHNRAGKGLGVQLLRSHAALEAHIGSDAFDLSIDGLTLVQKYVEAPEPFITRCEFVGGKFLYAVRVDTSDGFELCPADACVMDQDSLVCPAGAQSEKFKILQTFDHPLIAKWEAFLAANEIQIAGIEFIVDKDGNAYTYDVNTNTNYNADAEALDGRRGMLAAANYLSALLADRYSVPIGATAE